MDDPIIRFVERFCCPRGALFAGRRNRGYTPYDASSGAPVARLRPTGHEGRFEVKPDGLMHTVMSAIRLQTGGTELMARNIQGEHQIDRFKELARELECDEDEAVFDAALKRLAEAKPPPKYEPKKHAARKTPMSVETDRE